MEQSSAKSLAERILAQEADGASSAEEWLDAVGRTHDKLVRVLSPVLGDAGAHALVARSIHKTKPPFPAVAAVVTSGSPHAVREQLCTCLRQQDTAGVRAICTAALACFFRLLSTFIGGLARVMESISREIEAFGASMVVVDSFRAVARTAGAEPDEMALQRFVQLLALTLTSHEATTFLVGEYQEQEAHSNPVFTLADGIVWLYQSVARNSMVRRMQVMKMRGQAQIPGLHTLKMTDAGVRVFPRLAKPEEPIARQADAMVRLSTGVSGLDEMLGGGIPAGYSMLVAGPSGSGKTMLGTQFLLEGVAAGEPGLIVVFEKRPEQYLHASPHAMEIERLTAEGKVRLIYIRPLDLSVDETLVQIQEQARAMGARRLVIDSLSGFELALAPSFREDFRESLYRMIGAITNLGVTVLMTVEVGEPFNDLRITSHGISFLSDGIIWQRYAEMDGSLQKILAVVKLRGSPHSKELRTYEITEDGIVIGASLKNYRGIITGAPMLAITAKKRKSPRKKPSR